MALIKRWRLNRGDAIQTGMMFLAGLFVLAYSAALSLSQSVMNRGEIRSLRLDHWFGVLAWVVVFSLVHRETIRRLPGRDPFLLPAAALLCGWGLLTVWSMLPEFGIRQGVWVAICGAAMIAALRLPSDLGILRRYKYVWLFGSLLLTALTFLLGVNPLGYGPRMWLGCCGVYLQPSEPLKVLLIAYLAAEMADRRMLLSIGAPTGSEKPVEAIIPLVAPTLLMTALAISLLIIQRDLGTAAIFLFCYAAIVYVASQRKRFLLFAGLGLLFSAVIGVVVYDVVSRRIATWLNPWKDPSGDAFQIVQSLIAVANGGLIGRGPGLGAPQLVPLAHSDLIFAAVSEQTGLIGLLGMAVLVALIAGRGLMAAIRSPDGYRRYLAAGLTAYLAGQSLLIFAGTLRLLPLTGITLPFVSYGGSSLLVSMLALAVLLVISCPIKERPRAFISKPYLHLALVLEAGIVFTALAGGWWAMVRSPQLLVRTDNPRRAVSDRYVMRGSILDRDLETINETTGEVGALIRQTIYPPLSNVVGYTNPTYGQAGLEAEFDVYLRGLEGNLFPQIVWNNLIYGQPPPGLDIRLSIDLSLQRRADELLDGLVGALVVFNAKSGEILAIASHPTFDSNRLDEEWPILIERPDSPLFNRAMLGRYPVGKLEALFSPGLSRLDFASALSFDQSNNTPIDAASLPSGYSPLEVALAAASVTNEGVRPVPQLAMAVRYPDKGWTPLPVQDSSKHILDAETALALASRLSVPGKAFWRTLEVAPRFEDQPAAWFLGGTLPGSEGIPLAVAVVLEQDAANVADLIGQAMLTR